MRTPAGRVSSLWLWPCALFWVITGAWGLLQVVALIPLLSVISIGSLLTAVLFGTASVLSLVGAFLLLWRRRFAAPVLLITLVTHTSLVLVAGSPLSRPWGLVSILIVGCAFGSVIYARMLIKKGILV